MRDPSIWEAPPAAANPMQARVQARWTGENLQAADGSVRRLCLRWEVVGRERALS